MNLKEIRKSKGLKQSYVAEYLGVTPTTLSRYESGSRNVDIETLGKLADLYKVSIDEIIGRDAPNNEPPETLEIAKRVTERRTELNITREELAEKIGVSKSTMQRYESGAVQQIPFDKLEKIAEVLNTTVATLSGYEEEEKKAESFADVFTVLLRDEELLNTVLSLLRVKENSEDSYRNLTALIKGMSK